MPSGFGHTYQANLPMLQLGIIATGAMVAAAPVYYYLIENSVKSIPHNYNSLIMLEY